MKSKQKVDFVDYTPYAVNIDDDNHMGIHDDYRWSPDTKTKVNSYVGFNKNFAGVYKRFPCMNNVPALFPEIFSESCIIDKMRKSGSVQKSYDNCAYSAPITERCIYNT